MMLISTASIIIAKHISNNSLIHFFGFMLLVVVMQTFALAQPTLDMAMKMANDRSALNPDSRTVSFKPGDAPSLNDIPPLQKALILLNTTIQPGTATRLSWLPKQSLEGLYQPTPVLVVNGTHAGPVLCLTAAIHGDELNGIEIVRRILYSLDPEQLAGTIVGVPIVNLQGFQRTSRYLTDRRDLNRFFPGNPQGSSAARIAYSFFNEIINHCSFLVDIHTGSLQRTNLPQIRGDLRHSGVAKLAQGFGATVILHSEGTLGTLRRAAVDTGIPAVTLEAGKSESLQENAVNHGVEGIITLLNNMDMLKTTHSQNHQELIYYHSEWIRVDHGGILFSHVELGEEVKENQVLGTVTDPITNIRNEIISPYNGRVIGKALNQVVMPGFAGFHIGIQEPKEETLKIVEQTINLQRKQLQPPALESE